LDVTVAHPGKLKLIANADTTTDRVDAKELSRILRLGSVPASYVPTDEIRECRALVRGRQSLVETRTEYVNKIHGLLADVGISKNVKPLSVTGREFLEELSLETPWESLLSAHLGVIDELTEKIEELAEEIEVRAESLAETQLLMSAPGISHITALTLYAEIGDIGRFDGHKEVVSYVGYLSRQRTMPSTTVETST
jgi:transposase